MQGGVTFAPGEVDQAFNFGGVDGDVDLGTWFDFQSFTVDMWVNPAPGADQQAFANIIDNNHTGARSWVLQYFNTDDVYDFGTSGASDHISFSLTPNTWQHLALVRDGATYEARVYVNGQLVGSSPGTRDIVYDGTQFLRLGHWGGGTRYFKGLEDEVEIFNRVLSQSEIQAIYNAGSAGKCKPPQVTDAFSRKTHGAAGTFDILLPLTGNVGIECRSGGATNDYQMIINFANSVTVESAAVTSGTGSVSSFSVSGSQVTVNLTGVTNVQRITVTLFNVNDGTHMGNVPVSMGVLVGDVNGNAAVNASDVSLTKSQVGQAVSNSNFREDVNANGTISATDVALVKSDVGTALPP